MIGISFAYPDEADKLRHPPWTELRCARIEPGPELMLKEGRTVEYYWRNWDIPLEERTRLMEDIVKQLIQDHKVDGFTLWWNWTKKQWQMSHRIAGEGGWSVTFISQTEAEAVFATLQASHPDGPWKVRPEYVQDDEQAKMTPVQRTGIQANFNFEARKELPLDMALRCCRDAVERSIAILATYLPDEL